MDRLNSSHNDDRSSPIASTSSLKSKPTIIRRQTTSPRREHRRRASQPAYSTLPPPKFSGRLTAEDGEISADEIAGSSSSSSGEDDDSYQIGQKMSLEYLDLSLTLPYNLVSLRKQILLHCSQLEQRVKSLYPLSSSSSSSPDDHPDSQFITTFYAHLDALKDDLRKLAYSIPTSASNLSFPLTPQKASAAISARRQSLAVDWERLSTAVHDSLPVGPDLPTLPTFSLLADVDFASILSPLSAHLPTQGVRLLETVQDRFEALQDSVSAMTLRDCFYWARSNQASTEQAQVGGDIPPRPSFGRQISISSHQLFAGQFESIFDTIKAKGEEVRVRGRDSAASVARAAKDTEERLYLAAVDLARGGQRLIRYEHLPTLWKNNEHILSGYRFIPIDDVGALLKSTFQIHNETGNIMTHLIGSLIVIPLFWPSRDLFDEETTPMDRMVQTIYLIAALHCLVLSAAWHIMAGCSDACWFERFACVDYTGIAWLVAASVWTLVYNAFYCQPNLAMFYSFTTLLVGAVGAIVPWAAWFNDRKNKPIRIAIFLAMCFTGVGPFLHAGISHGFLKTSLFFSPILPSLAAYISGLIFYATNFPERIAPGRFDVVGHAHQIWHISIVVAILFHYRATNTWHQGRFDFSCSYNPLKQSTTSAIVDSIGGNVAEIASSLFGEASAFHKAKDLNVADDIIHGWRISAGKLGHGMVGKVWDWSVDRIMQVF
jgi:adiponectin receptor